jgi:hypothetical protein
MFPVDMYVMPVMFPQVRYDSHGLHRYDIPIIFLQRARGACQQKGCFTAHKLSIDVYLSIKDFYAREPGLHFDKNPTKSSPWHF